MTVYIWLIVITNVVCYTNVKINNNSYVAIILINKCICIDNSNKLFSKNCIFKSKFTDMKYKRNVSSVDTNNNDHMLSKMYHQLIDLSEDGLRKSINHSMTRFWTGSLPLHYSYNRTFDIYYY